MNDVDNIDEIGGKLSVVDKWKYFKKIGYRPHSKQELYHNSAARFRVPCCGRRFGKSKMAGVDREPWLLNPGRREWIVGPTYDLGEKEFRVIWDDMIIKMGLGRNKKVKRGYNKKQGVMYLEFPWQTRLEVRSADHPENLVGDSLHHVIMSEAAKHRADTFDRYVRAALADHRGGADFPTTPEGMNWFYDLWLRGQDPDIDDHESWRFPSWDNPYVYPKGRADPEIRRIEKSSSKEWFLQEIAADFTAFVGKIYGEFTETTHVKKHEFNPAWPNYMAFDWGYTNPMACVEFQVDPMDRIYVWRMWYESYMTLNDYIAMIKATPNPEGYHLDLAFGDAADPGAAETVSQQLVPCLADDKAKSGVEEMDGPNKGKKPQSGWRQGVDLLNSFLKMREPSDNVDLTDMVSQLDLSYAESLRGPGLFVDHKCKPLIREFNSYKAPPDVRGTGVTRETAVGPNHALDALRYALMHIFRLGARSHLSDIYPPSEFAHAGRSALESLPETGYFTLANMDF